MTEAHINKLLKKLHAMETLAQMMLNECHDARALAAGIGTPVTTPKGAKRDNALTMEERQRIVQLHRQRQKKPAQHVENSE